VIGFDPDYVPFLEPIRGQVARAGSRLRESDRVLLSSNSHPDFGWQLWPQFQGWELGSVKVDVVGPFSLTRSLGADGAVLCTAANYARCFGLPASSAVVNFGLVSLQPGTEPGPVARRLRSALPRDVQVLSRDALYEREGEYWIAQTPSGQMFSFGVLLSMVVAAVVVYQELSNDIRNHLPEYATLKAMGYADSYLIGVILAQAGIYATTCFPPAVALSLAVYRMTASLAGIPMQLSGRNLLVAFVLIVVFSHVAGILSLRKLRRADPAELFAK
jgi:putative ABC transport system permease protein